MTRTRWLTLIGVAFLASAPVVATPADSRGLWVVGLGLAFLCLASIQALSKRRRTARLAAVAFWSGIAVFSVVAIGLKEPFSIGPVPPPGYVAPPSASNIGLGLSIALLFLSAMLFAISIRRGIHAGRAERNASPTGTGN